MKNAIYFFIGCFCVTFIIGLINGIHSVPDKDKVFVEAGENIKLQVNNDISTLLLFKNGTPIYAYNVNSSTLKQVSAIGNIANENELFPMHSDDLIAGSLVGALGAPTIAEVIKNGKSAEPDAAAYKVIPSILGVIFGYWLGYYIGEPKVDINEVVKELSNEKSWQPLAIEFIRIKSKALMYKYCSLSVNCNDSNKTNITENEKLFILFSFQRLYELQKANQVFNNLNCTLIYIGKREKWYNIFSNYRLKNKVVYETFKDDYYGINYPDSTNQYPFNRLNYLVLLVDSLNKNKIDRNASYEVIRKIINKQDVWYFNKILTKEANVEPLLGIFQALNEFPNSITYRKMLWLKDNNNKSKLALNAQQLNILNEMILNYPIDCMDD